MNLENVTVIIPAHNRPERLRRLLRYYSATNINIIVSDSSKQIFDYDHQSHQIRYFHFPNEQFLRKIANILHLIKTPYVLYCADDDFIVPQAIEKIVDFLEMNPDYNSAQGHYVTFEMKKKGIEFCPGYIRNFDKDINQDLSSERITEFRNLYASLLYSVIRSSTFKEMYAKCIDGEKLKFKNLFLAEIYFNFYSLMEGKNKTLPVFYGARERIEGSATESTVPLSVVSKSPEYEVEFQNFTEILIRQLVSKQNLAEADAKALIFSILEDPKKDHIHPLKRKLLNIIKRYGHSVFMKKILRYRYISKGLQRVKGMQSYPCTFSTPEKELIIKHIFDQQKKPPQ
ncbi:MAG TPA: TIGR00180 family glycosyltransferase [Prolixibacteraceae bacterium]|nr:TIGR00180 family glycosyltransferase [Prolixibacteraceae bacterium]